MKLAKKVLAIVMALAMIGCCAAMAFAADTASYSMEIGEVEDGMVPVTLYANNAVGLTSGKIVFKYDAAVLAFSYNENTEDADAVANTKSNGFSPETNGTVAGEVQFAFYFKTSLVADFAADAKPKKEVKIDSNKFALQTIYFEVKDEAAATTTITFTDDTNGVAEANAPLIGKPADVVITLKTVEETTTAAQETTVAAETTTEAAIIVESTTAEANPNTGDKNTGDNMALAAAAGVVALAGAAFIISKKRK